MPRKYSVEFKDKAVHLVVEMVRLESCSLQRVYEEVGELFGVSHHSLRAWYRESVSARDRSEVSGGETEEEELKRLHRENRELRRANGILKTASGFSQRNSTVPRPHDLLYRYLQGGIWGRGHLPRLTAGRSWIHHFTRLPSSLDTHPSARALSDSLLIPEIQRVLAENFSVSGTGRMWHTRNRKSLPHW